MVSLPTNKALTLMATLAFTALDTVSGGKPDLGEFEEKERLMWLIPVAVIGACCLCAILIACTTGFGLMYAAKRREAQGQMVYYPTQQQQGDQVSECIFDACLDVVWLCSTLCVF
jgi:hypothetical protein